MKILTQIIFSIIWFIVFKKIDDDTPYGVVLVLLGSIVLIILCILELFGVISF